MAHDEDCLCDECCSAKIEINTKTYIRLVALLSAVRGWRADRYKSSRAENHVMSACAACDRIEVKHG